MTKQMRYLSVSLAIIVSLLAGCTDEKAADYVTVVPADADAVAAVRLDELVRKSDVTRTIWYKLALSNLSKNQALAGGASEALVAFAKDPSVMGVDFSKAAYLFKVGDQVGLSLKVDDSSLLDEFVSRLAGWGVCSKVKQHDDLTWSRLLDEVNMVWNDNTLLMMYSQAQLVNDRTMLALMTQPADQSFAATSRFNQLKETKGDDISLYVNLAVAPDGVKDAMRPMMPAGAKYSDVELVAGLDFQNGSVTLSSLMFSSNDKIQAEIDKKYSALKPIGTGFVNKIPRGSTAWMLFGADGTTLLNLLKSLPGMKEKLLAAGLGVDVEAMIRAIDGDVMLVTHTNANDIHEDLNMRMYAEVANTDFMADADYWMESARDYGIKLNQLAEGEYSIHADDTDFFMAAADKTLYFGNSRYEVLQAQGQNAFAGEISGKNLFVMFDASKLNPKLSTITAASARSGELVVTVNMANKNNNIIAELLQVVLGQLWQF